nr:DNA-3-methyladenine glycosylase [Sphingobium herbicidovorans]
MRALETTHGIMEMTSRRSTSDLRRLCSGPGRLCQALEVDASLNGAQLFKAPFQLFGGKGWPTVAGRIGISVSVEIMWRFGVGGSPFLSCPFPANKTP